MTIETIGKIQSHAPATGVIAFGIIICALLQSHAHAQVFLPGMQPEEAGIEFAKVRQCIMCHANTKNGEADPYFSWQSGMMSQSARDPVFRAALVIANQDIEGVGEFCWRCHTPRGWLEGRSSPPDGAGLNDEDRQGVSCDVCHRLIDPLSKQAAELIEHVPPGLGNAMMVADPANVVLGPYGDGKGAKPHKVRKSAYHASSELCAVCHNVSNPLAASDVKTQPPHGFGTVERTYSEWALSDYAGMGSKGTCQSCHYEVVPAGGQASRFGDLHRDYFVRHGPVGGSSWVQDATRLMERKGDTDPDALAMGKERAKRLLKTAASLDLAFPSPGQARLRITNLTGHKLPTGYPEGRRMWINVKYFDASGALIREDGAYGEKKETIFGKPVDISTLLHPEATRIYECVPAMSEMQAEKYGKKPGKSFHFVLNDVISKDNRIPPKGFTNIKFAEHLCQPIGAAYADGQHWDDVILPLPDGCARITVRLMYQSVSWEYIKFLAEENRTDDRGRQLYEVWEKTGRCEPVEMAELTKEP